MLVPPHNKQAFQGNNNTSIMQKIDVKSFQKGGGELNKEVGSINVNRTQM